MSTTIRSNAVLAVVASLCCAASMAQASGETIYKQGCLNCHGSNGMADSGIGQVMRVKAVTNPEVRKFTEAEMIEFTRNGSGKMQAYKGELTEAQIKSSADYFRMFMK